MTNTGNAMREVWSERQAERCGEMKKERQARNQNIW